MEDLKFYQDKMDKTMEVLIADYGTIRACLLYTSHPPGYLTIMFTKLSEKNNKKNCSIVSG